jgi:hypothetical protein
MSSGLTLTVPTTKTHQRIRSADFKVKDSFTLSPNDAELYKNAKDFDTLVQLNVDFLGKKVNTSPFTLELHTETNALINQLTTINTFGFLTVCSSPGIVIKDDHSHEIGFQKAHLQGLIYGEERMEQLEVGFKFKSINK